MTLDHIGKVRIIPKEVCPPRHHLSRGSTSPPNPRDLVTRTGTGARVERLEAGRFSGSHFLWWPGVRGLSPLPGIVPC